MFIWSRFSLVKKVHLLLALLNVSNNIPEALPVVIDQGESYGILYSCSVVHCCVTQLGPQVHRHVHSHHPEGDEVHFVFYQELPPHYPQSQDEHFAPVDDPNHSVGYDF